MIGSTCFRTGQRTCYLFPSVVAIVWEEKSEKPISDDLWEPDDISFQRLPPVDQQLLEVLGPK